MNWIISQWENWKARSFWSKLSDVVFTALLVAMLIPDGRIFMQRLVLQTGLFGTTTVNADDTLSEASKNWKLTNLEGQSITLDDLKGKVVFINFWATWCPPCNAEMPGIIELMSNAEENVEYLFVTNEAPQTVQAHLMKKEWDIPAYIQTTSPGAELAAASLPTTYIIDRDGKVVHHSSGMKQWNDQEAIDLLTDLASVQH